MFQLVRSPERKFTCYGLSMNNFKALTKYYLKAHEILYKLTNINNLESVLKKNQQTGETQRNIPYESES